MGPENPPRRSKSDQEPLTIDLTANSAAADDAKNDASAEPVANGDTADIRAGEADETVRADIAEASDDAKTDTGSAVQADEEDTRAEAASAAFAEEPVSAATAAEEPVRPVYPAQHRTSSSGAFAAGHSRWPDRPSRRRRPAICRRHAVAWPGRQQYSRRTEPSQRHRSAQSAACGCPGTAGSRRSWPARNPHR